MGDIVCSMIFFCLLGHASFCLLPTTMRANTSFQCSSSSAISPAECAEPRSDGLRNATFEFLGRQHGLRGGAATAREAALHGVHTQQRSKLQPVFLLSESVAAPEKGLRIVRVKGDGRCLFRAMAKGLAHNKGHYLAGNAEECEADELRLAVADVLCNSEPPRREFKDVTPSIEAEGGLGNYCKRLGQPEFWGGEVEILVLSRLLHAPIYVYRTAEEAGRSDWGFVPIVKYGEDWADSRGGRQARRPVHLLYTGGNHYDLLL